MSHRYGSRPPPSSISQDLYRKLEFALVDKPDEKLFLSQMYRIDENDLDSKYLLRPIDDPKQWPTTENKLQLILRQAADMCYQQKIINTDERF